MPSELHSLTLFYRQGTSDKVYRLSIEPIGDRFAVNFRYGRRGAALQTGTKTPVPVNLEAAKRIYDTVAAEKAHEGYAAEEEALPLMPTVESGAFRRDFASAIQDELWARNYGHSWGTGHEFAALLSGHSELASLKIKDAADLVLTNLAVWSPVLAAKEAKAKKAYVSPEQAKETQRRIEQLRQAIRTKIQVGPEGANVFVCDFDPEKEPKLKTGIWAVFSGDRLAGSFDSQEKAMARARELKDRAHTFETHITDNGKSITLEIRATKIQA